MVDSSFTIFSSSVPEVPISCLHAACSVCKVETGMKPDTRTVKTQYPSRYSEHTSLWTPEELSVLRRRHDQAVSEKNRQTNRADLLERELKDAETANKNLESEVSLLRKNLGERKCVNESDKVHLSHATNELRAMTDEAEELRETLQAEKKLRLEMEHLIHHLESSLRMKNQEVEKLSTKLENHEDRLRAAASLHTKSLRDEFSLERARLKQENQNLEEALRVERNNHLITTRALEQMQLHYGCGVMPNEENIGTNVCT